MSVAHIESIMVSHVEDNLDVFALPSTFDKEYHIKYPNAPFNDPNNHPWLGLYLNINDIVQQDASACREMVKGIFTVQVNFPGQKGSIDCLQVADLIKSNFVNHFQGDAWIEKVLVKPNYGGTDTTTSVQVWFVYENAVADQDVYYG